MPSLLRHQGKRETTGFYFAQIPEILPSYIHWVWGRHRCGAAIGVGCGEAEEQRCRGAGVQRKTIINYQLSIINYQLFSLPPTPYTLHPTPYTLSPPYTLHPTPHTLRFQTEIITDNLQNPLAGMTIPKRIYSLGHFVISQRIAQ